jgi:uncharacterized membrane protein YeaQ/YmgE (transglycosylase-associated protein family)
MTLPARRTRPNGSRREWADEEDEEEEMHVIFRIIVGTVAGALARRVVPGVGPVGVGRDRVIGVVGALAEGGLPQMRPGQTASGSCSVCSS